MPILLSRGWQVTRWRGPILAAAAIGLLAVALLMLGTSDMLRRQRDASHWVKHTLEVLAEAAVLDGNLSFLTSEEAGYFLDQSADSLSRFETGSQQVLRSLAALRALTADNPTQNAALDRLAARVTALRDAVERARTDDEQGAIRLAQTQRGRLLMDQVRAAIEGIRAEEKRLLDERSEAEQRTERWLVTGLVACGVLVAAAVLFAAALLADRKRQRARFEELRASKARFDSLFDGMFGFMGLLAPDGTLIEANRAALELAGVPAEAVAGRPFWEAPWWTGAPDPEAPSRLRRAVMEAAAGAFVRYEVEVHGVARGAMIDFSLRPIRDERGAIVLLAAEGRDVAERKAAEAALRESEARLQLAQRIGRIGCFDWEVASDHATYSDEYAILHGLPPGTVTERFESWLARVHPEDREHAAAMAAAVFEPNPPPTSEYRIIRPSDGAIRWIMERRQVFYGEDGRAQRVIGSQQDVTEQREAEAVLARHRDELESLVAQRTAELVASETRLRESEARFRMLAEHASDTVSRVGADGTLLYISPAAARIFGVPSEALVEDGFLSRIHPEDRDSVATLRTRLLSGAVESETLSFRVVNPDRGEVWVEAGKRLLRCAQTGRPDGYVAVLRDVTERKRLETALRHSQKMEVIGRIAAGVAHDFNNILQGVTGGLELVLDEIEAGTPAHEFAGVALSAARRGSYLTHHLLSYAKKQVLRPRALDLAPFLADMQKLLSRALGPHIAITVSVGAGTPSVHVDPNQLQTALLNLAVNAAHAMPQGGTLALGACPIGLDGGRVRVTVSDTGRGMDEATLVQACEPFFTTKGREGTGLGLSMVQGFAEQSGGSMRISSVPGKGTAVELWLLASPEREERSYPEPSKVSRSTGRVLLVDDEPDVLVTTGAFLERAGLDVVRAGSGDQALALLASAGRFDALVTDHAMPGLNGADLAAEGRFVQPGLPVLIITGFAEVKGIEALPEGVLVLHKPFQRGELVAALEQMMTPG